MLPKVCDRLTMKTMWPIAPFASAATAEAPHALCVRLETPPVVLESVKDDRETQDLFCAIYGDPRVQEKNMRATCGKTASIGFLQNHVKAWRNGSPLSIIMTRKRDDGRLIGTISVTPDSVPDRVNLGFAFLPKFWRRGYAGEAVRAYVYNTLALLTVASAPQTGNQPVREVCAQALSSNVASRRVLESCGFSPQKQESMGADSVVFFTFPPGFLKISWRC